MSLHNEHQEWQEEKIKQALDKSCVVLEERNTAYPARETLETSIWCSTRGSVVSEVLGQVPKNLQGLVRSLRDQIQQTSQATTAELMQTAEERINFSEATIDVIINVCQGKSEVILPVKETSRGIAQRIYVGCQEVLEQQRLVGFSNNYASYAIIQLDEIVNHQDLGERIKADLDKRLESYNVKVNIAYNFAFDHAYDDEPKIIKQKPDSNNGIITIQPPQKRNGKAKFLPLDPRIKADIVTMLKAGARYDDVRDKYKTLAGQGQIPDSRLSCYKSHITMKTY